MIKPAPADCVSQCKSTETELHYSLCSGNTDRIESSTHNLTSCLHTAKWLCCFKPTLFRFVLCVFVVYVCVEWCLEEWPQGVTMFDTGPKHEPNSRCRFTLL